MASNSTSEGENILTVGDHIRVRVFINSWLDEYLSGVVVEKEIIKADFTTEKIIGIDVAPLDRSETFVMIERVKDGS